ncbi:MAG: manganese efflux pump [Butyrivibrio sp.]|nr:manganese efflux pump [Butyrivibrio sp.]
MAKILIFILNSSMLGLGLAMDAFSVSLANGFADSKMTRRRRLEIAGVYAVFQFLMPAIGWFLVHNAANIFIGIQPFIPWIALILLAIIGAKMLSEGMREKECRSGAKCATCTNTECVNKNPDSFSESLSNKTLFIQGIATSIDALSVGFTISKYNTGMVLIASSIIGFVTLIVCYVGLKLGIKFGTRLAGNAKIIGGLILIGIGLEIFFS